MGSLDDSEAISLLKQLAGGCPTDSITAAIAAPLFGYLFAQLQRQESDRKRWEFDRKIWKAEKKTLHNNETNET